MSKNDVAILDGLKILPQTVAAVLEGAVVNRSLWLDSLPELTPENNWRVERWTFSNESHRKQLFALGCAGLKNFPPPLSGWQSMAKGFPPIAIEYFWGVWRDHFYSYHSSGFGEERYDRKMARERLSWINNYRAAVSIAAAFSDWKSFDRLIEWPGEDLPFDEGTDDRTPEDLAFHTWFAMTLRGEQAQAITQATKVRERQDSESQDDPLLINTVLAAALRGEGKAAAVEQATRVVNGRRRRPKALLSIAESIFNRDEPKFRREMESYLKGYLKNEFRPNRIDFAVACDATMLWHVARRRGMKNLQLDPKVFFLIGRPDESGTQ